MIERSNPALGELPFELLASLGIKKSVAFRIQRSRVLDDSGNIAKYSDRQDPEGLYNNLSFAEGTYGFQEVGGRKRIAGDPAPLGASFGVS